MAPALSDEPDGARATWKVGLPCTRAEAEALTGDIAQLATLESPPVLMTSEADGGAWRMDAYFAAEPGQADIDLLLALAPSARGTAPKAEKLEDEDWVTLSQAGLEPIRAGRFFVHTPTHREDLGEGMIAFEIDAGLAFGTGQHATTAGCLEALDRVARAGQRFANIADIGTGTGLLAFAALALWPQAKAIATDIDPISIDVTRDNAAINGVKLGHGASQLLLAVADGMDHPLLAARAPFDLLIANILAGPLIDLAPAFAKAVTPAATLVLAGLLDTQADAVIAAYEAQAMTVTERGAGEWRVLVLRAAS